MTKRKNDPAGSGDSRKRVFSPRPGTPVILGCAMILALSTVGLLGADAGTGPNTGAPNRVSASAEPARRTAELLSVPAAATAPATPSSVRVDRKSATSLRVWWSKVEGAKSYKVSRLVTGKWKVVKTTSALAWTDKKLPKKTVQQYQVAACADAKGKGRCSAWSPLVYATTFNSAKDDRVNVTAIKLVNFPSDVLGIYDEWAFAAELAPSRWGEQKRKQAASRSLRMTSSDPSVISVTSWDVPIPDGIGKLVAKKVGSAVITVTAHNGLSVSARVYVGERACPLVLHDPISGWLPSVELAPVVQAHGDKICELTRYAIAHPGAGGWAGIDENGQITTKYLTGLPAHLVGYAKDILSSGSIYPMDLAIWDRGIQVRVYLNDIPWGEPGSQRDVLAYETIWYTYSGAPPKTHWETFRDEPGETYYY